MLFAWAKILLLFQREVWISKNDLFFLDVRAVFDSL